MTVPVCLESAEVGQNVSGIEPDSLWVEDRLIGPVQLEVVVQTFVFPGFVPMVLTALNRLEYVLLVVVLLDQTHQLPWP